jgi:hypothetical protein
MIYMFGPSKSNSSRLLLRFLEYSGFTTWNGIRNEVFPQYFHTKLIGHIIFLNYAFCLSQQLETLPDTL